MTRKILKVAQREFLEAVKTKAFIISFVITAVIFIGMIVVMDLAPKMKPISREPTRIAITDLSGKLNDEIKKVFDNYNSTFPSLIIIPEIINGIPKDVNNLVEKQKVRVREGALKAFVLLDNTVIDGKGKSQYFMVPKNISDMETFDTVTNLLNESVRSLRIKEHNLSDELVKKLFERINIEQVNLGSKTEKTGFSFSIVMVPFFFLWLMFMGIFGVSQQMLTSVIEEKNSRVYEVLLSSLSPFELMSGKILGLSGVGFIMIGVWGSVALGFAVYKDFTNLISFNSLIYFLLYFIFGFLLFSSLIAAIGSTCNTIREAQSYMTPITLVSIIPMLTWFYIAQNPNGTLAITLSFIPLMTPFIMMLRLAANPTLPIIQIIASLLLLGISVPIAIAFSAKIFRTGILMYGKQPSPREILRWFKYK